MEIKSSELLYCFKKCMELDLIDTNCNDCIFMDRDLLRYYKWHDWHKNMALMEFYNAKGKCILEAWGVIDKASDESELKNGKGMLRVAMKMRFEFEKKFLLQYGTCIKFKKPVSFIPMVCQIENKECFKHRRADVVVL